MAASLLLLWWAAAAGATSIYVQRTPSRGSGGELGPVEVAGSVVLCALHCERAGPACVGFRAEGAAGCVLLSGLAAGRGGTFVRGCGGLRLAYRAVPPMPRSAAEAECTADGGRMAVPLSGQQRGCVQRVVDAAGAVPGFLPADAEHTDVAYVGLLVHEPTEYRTTDLRGAPVTVPDDAWEPGQPNGGTELSYMAIASGLLLDYYTTAVMMNVCEWPL